MKKSSNRTQCTGEFVYRGIVWNSYTTPEVVQRCEDFRFRPSDICVCTFPRSGTTLVQEIVWEIVNREIISAGEKFPDIDVRFPFLEFNPRWEGDSSLTMPIDLLESAPQESVRLIKSHCPYSFIKNRLDEAAPKVIVVARNPKDNCNSLYKFYKGMPLFGPWPGGWDEFFDIFMRGGTKCGDYFQVVSEWWQQRHKPNLLFLKYEDLVRQPRRYVCQVAEFLDQRLTAGQLDMIAHNCRFESMRANENVNFSTPGGFNFIRKGIVGDWKTQLTVAQSEALDAAVKEKLDPIGLKFDYE